MDLASLEIALVTARVAYQVEVNGEPYLVDPDHVNFEILPPGAYDSKTEEHLKAWTIILGEEGDRGIMRAEGATLAEAAQEFARVVRLRAATVRSMLGPESQ
mgnify:CR=1 FL=1